MNLKVATKPLCTKLDILTALKRRWSLLSQEWQYVTACHWFLLLAALLHHSLHRLKRDVLPLKHLLRQLYQRYCCIHTQHKQNPLESGGFLWLHAGNMGKSGWYDERVLLTPCRHSRLAYIQAFEKTFPNLDQELTYSILIFKLHFLHSFQCYLLLTCSYSLPLSLQQLSELGFRRAHLSLCEGNLYERWLFRYLIHPNLCKNIKLDFWLNLKP